MAIHEPGVAPKSGVSVSTQLAVSTVVTAETEVDVQLSALSSRSGNPSPLVSEYRPGTYAHIAEASTAAHEPGVMPKSGEFVSAQSVVSASDIPLSIVEVQLSDTLTEFGTPLAEN
jgi:hypothetical protein